MPGFICRDGSPVTSFGVAQFLRRLAPSYLDDVDTKEGGLRVAATFRKFTTSESLSSVAENTLLSYGISIQN